MKRKFFIFFCALILVLAFSAVAETAIQQRYEEAQGYLALQEYEKARDAFRELGAYQDATEYAMYAGALLKADQGLYSAAIIDLSALDDFADSKLRQDYYSALLCENREVYEKARSYYNKMPGFLDCSERLAALPEKINIRDYEKADRLENNNKLEKALEIFRSLGQYKDSSARANALIEKIQARDYEKADQFEKDGMLAEAYDAFIALNSYKDSSERAAALYNPVMYAKALSLADEGDYKRASNLFATLGDYNDSMEKAYVLGVVKYVDKVYKPENRVFVFEHHNTYGIVNYKDNIAKPALFDEITDFEGGIAAYRINDKWGVLYDDGRTSAAAWDYVSSFSKINDKYVAQVIQKEKFGYISSEAQVLLDPKWDRVSEYNQDGICIIVKSNQSGKNTTYYFGLADSDGNVLCEPSYTKLGYSDNSKFAYKDTDDNSLILQMPESGTVPFIVRTKDGKYGLLDHTGRMIGDVAYEDAHEFSEGLAAVKSKDLWGFVNQYGEYAIAPEYLSVTDFKNDRADVLIAESGWHIIDKDNHRIYYSNKALADAEKLMKEGKYFEAIIEYDLNP